MPEKPGLASCPPTMEGRVQMCMKLMRAGKWRRGVTDKNIAAHWGLHIDSVAKYSSEAWRRIKAEVTDPDQTAATICIALENVIHEAKDKGLYGHRSIIEAGKAWASIAGAGAPTRVEIGALANLSDAELEKRRQEIILKLSEGQHPAGEGQDSPVEVGGTPIARDPPQVPSRPAPEASAPEAPPRETE